MVLASGHTLTPRQNRGNMNSTDTSNEATTTHTEINFYLGDNYASCIDDDGRPWAEHLQEAINEAKEQGDPRESVHDRAAVTIVVQRVGPDEDGYEGRVYEEIEGEAVWEAESNAATCGHCGAIGINDPEADLMRGGISPDNEGVSCCNDCWAKQCEAGIGNDWSPEGGDK